VSISTERLKVALSGRYDVERELGTGGMGAVFLARDVKHDRRVAIKVFHPELAASLGAERFLHEISVTAGLAHPHILPLYDSGEVSGLLYYVMPYVEGESLRDRLSREQMLPIEEAVRIAAEVAEALDYAHQHGIVHRDIKPANIQLSGGHAVVADFGISRALDAAGGTRLTQSGMAVGTPAYMSPEQANGVDALDGRSDIYSLGCVLYEMLVGSAPFSGLTPQALLARHTLDQVSRPSIVRPTVPVDLEEIVLQALAKLPVDRFRTAGELAEALSTVISGTVPAFRRTGPVRRVRSPRRGALTAGIAAMAVLAALLLVRPFVPRLTRAEPTLGELDRHRIAVLYFQDRSPDRSLGYLTDGLTESLIDRLALVRGLDVVSSNGVARYRGAEVARDSIARALRVGTLVEGSVEEVGSRVRVTARLVDGASGAEFDQQAIEWPRADVLVLRDSLAQDVAHLVRESLGEEIELQTLKATATSPEAWSLLHQGRRLEEGIWPLLDLDSADAAARLYDRVDSLLSAAERLDPGWATPTVDRARLAYERSQWHGTSDRPYSDRWSRVALDHVERVLQVAPHSADALEVRGTTRYWRWLMGLEVDADSAARLFAGAEADLRAAVAENRGQAGAWEILSHLLLNKPGARAEARLAAQRAYEADAYLRDADRVVERLYLASYDLDDYGQAKHWCALGEERFPTVPRFKECQIWIMTMTGGEPDPDAAWRLVDEYVQLNPEGYRPFRSLKARMATAAVLARAGLADSARAVVRRSLAERSVDPARDTYMDGAFALTLTGDLGEAVSLLKEWVSANPNRALALVNDDYWWWRVLQGRADFQALAAMATTK
jgi:TolB-like protein